MTRIAVQIGNGDVVTAQDAQDLVRHTRCDGVMIGRGAVQDPLIFHRIRAIHGNAISEEMLRGERELIQEFLRTLASNAIATVRAQRR